MWKLLETTTVHPSLASESQPLANFVPKGRASMEKKNLAMGETIKEMEGPLTTLVPEVIKIKDESASLKRGMADQ